jgi:hypothetical protein
MLGKTQGVEVAAALTSEHLLPGGKILYRETGWIKLNGNIIITS